MSQVFAHIVDVNVYNVYKMHIKQCMSVVCNMYKVHITNCVCCVLLVEISYNK